MYAIERHRAILERTRRDGRVDVADIGQALGVTPETIRRDLIRLETQGLVRRVHGGAVPVETFGLEPTVSLRAQTMAAEKRRIARAALAEVPLRGSILLDAGTTTIQLAQILPADRELTVVTNSPSIALALTGFPNFTVLILGGRIRQQHLSSVGDWAEQNIEAVLVDVAFMATNGVSVERGLTTPDQAEARTKRAMLRSGRHAVLLADHTKVGNDCFARVADLREIEVFITDSGLDQKVAEQLMAAGPRVVRA